MAVAIGVSPAPASASASEWPSAAEAAVTTVVPEEEEEEGDRAGEGRGDAEPALAADVAEVTRTTCASACGGSEGYTAVTMGDIVTCPSCSSSSATPRSLLVII